MDLVRLERQAAHEFLRPTSSATCLRYSSIAGALTKNCAAWRAYCSRAAIACSAAAGPTRAVAKVSAAESVGGSWSKYPAHERYLARRCAADAVHEHQGQKGAWGVAVGCERGGRFSREPPATGLGVGGVGGARCRAMS